MPDDFITVTISDQDFKIKCSELEVELLNRSAAYLDIKMSELKKSSPTLPKEKVAIMAALNIVSDFLKREDEYKDYENISKDIESIQNSLNLEELK
tara:strand:+ start:263 stop:550 length:288 start_codon:yes stop_codon:yes gene_type:complete